MVIVLHRRSSEPDDAEPAVLISAAVCGDLSVFEQLYRQFSPRIFGLCLRLTGQREAAEDCTQESFIAAWRADLTEYVEALCCGTVEAPPAAGR